MNVYRWAVVTALALSATGALAQTEPEEEQSVFVEVLESNVQLPLSFAAAVCGLTVEEVAAEFAGTTDVACTVAEDRAARVGLVDADGELVDLSRQGFVNILLPDNETRLQLPVGLAAQVCEIQESQLAENPASVRLVACELDQEQLEESGLAELLATPGEAAGAADGQESGAGTGTEPGQAGDGGSEEGGGEE